MDALVPGLVPPGRPAPTARRLVVSSLLRAGWLIAASVSISAARMPGAAMPEGFAETPKAGAAGEYRIEVAPGGVGSLRIHAHALIDAAPDTVWETLTDYDHFPRFIPGLLVSRVIGEDRGAPIVRQSWRISLAFLSVPIDVTVRSIERPPSVVEVHLVAGNVRRLEGRYLIERTSDRRTALSWDGELEASALLPDWLSMPIVRRQAEVQFRGMIDEIERRNAARVAAHGPTGANPSALHRARVDVEEGDGIGRHKPAILGLNAKPIDKDPVGRVQDRHGYGFRGLVMLNTAKDTAGSAGSLDLIAMRP